MALSLFLKEDRQLCAFPFYASLLQAIAGVMSLALCLTGATLAEGRPGTLSGNPAQQVDEAAH